MSASAPARMRTQARARCASPLFRERRGPQHTGAARRSSAGCSATSAIAACIACCTSAGVDPAKLTRSALPTTSTSVKRIALPDRSHADAGCHRGNVSSSGRPVQIQRMCPECEDELQRSPFGIRRQPTDFVFEGVEEDERLQAKAVAGQAPQVTPEMESQLADLQGRGQQCPASVRAYFEPRLGYDLSPVRIHTDARAYADGTRRSRARLYARAAHRIRGRRTRTCDI